MADGSRPGRAGGGADGAPCAEYPESVVAHLPGAAFVRDRTPPWHGGTDSHRFVDGCGFGHEIEARAVTVTVDGEAAVELILRDVTERTRAGRIQTALQESSR